MDDPTFADILAARDLLAGYLPPTPMWSYPALDAVVGATVFVKHENIQPTGAFKVRGGLNLLAGMAPQRRTAGLVSYSTGNHAQSLAYACATFDVGCTVVMPAGTSRAKVRAARAFGASVVLDGADLAAAQRRAEELAAWHGWEAVSPGDTPALVAGVGTLYLEILQARPDLDAIVVPVGSGTGAAAAGLVAAALASGCRIVAVQSAAAPAAHDSWRAGACVERPNRTAVEGLATGRGFELTQRLMRTGVRDFHLVSDTQIADAQRLLASHAHTLGEGAGRPPWPRCWPGRRTSPGSGSPWCVRAGTPPPPSWPASATFSAGCPHAASRRSPRPRAGCRTPAGSRCPVAAG